MTRNSGYRNIATNELSAIGLALPMTIRGNVMRLAVIAIALLCSACALSRAEQDSADNAQCMSYGAKLGTDSYVACRVQLDTARTNATATANAAGTIGLSNVRPR